MIIVVIQFIIFLLYLIKSYIYLANLFQQNHYDKLKYIKSIKKYYISKKYQYFYYIGGLFLIGNIFWSKLYYITLIMLVISFFFFNKYIIKLKVTKRIIRLSITTFLLLTVYNIITINIYMINYLSVLLLPFIILLANLLNYPIEKLINKRYIKMARKKLSSIPIKQKIAITGSFGKTTTKNIIYSIYQNNYLVQKTPKSYNTILGISKTINENLKYPLDIYIMEMGAFRLKEISEMSNLYLPNISIITEIGEQHMSTFKNIDNVIKAKFEILNGMDKNGIVILNYENKYIREYNIKDFNNIYTYGINYGRFIAKNIIYHQKYTTFDIYDNELYLFSIKTLLLGKHQVLNILCAYCAVLALREKGIIVGDNEFIKVVQILTNSEHRLSYKFENNIHIYDDSYSSNINGFTNACELLKLQDGKKIIITPGIVDGGDKDIKLNTYVASILKDVFDSIYLIDNPSSRIIAKYLDDNSINYLVFSNFKLAYLNIFEQYNVNKEKVNLLIENDLPDSFLER